MTELYLALEQQACAAADRELTEEYLTSVEYQARQDAQLGEPNKELFLDPEYWQYYCEGLKHKYCRKFERYPQVKPYSVEDENLLF